MHFCYATWLGMGAGLTKSNRVLRRCAGVQRRRCMHRWHVRKRHLRVQHRPGIWKVGLAWGVWRVLAELSMPPRGFGHGWNLCYDVWGA